MADRLDPTFVRAQIEHLRLIHPDIWEDGDEALLAGMLEGSTDLHEFLARAVGQIRETEKLIIGQTSLMADLKARRDRYERREEALRALSFQMMQHADVKKIELPQATLSIRQGTPKVIITDEARLPPDCIRIKREPDKVVIRDRLRDGIPVSGAELSNAEPVLAMRPK